MIGTTIVIAPQPRLSDDRATPRPRMVGFDHA